MMAMASSAVVVMLMLMIMYDMPKMAHVCFTLQHFRVCEIRMNEE